jgi:DNA-binding transcriptional regulator YiaG
MTSMQGGSRTLKADALGRVRTPGIKREEILDEFEKSGLSGVAFAALVGVKYPTLASWVRRRRRKPGAAKPVREVRFLEAVAGNDASATDPAPLELELPCGARLRITGLTQVPLAVALIRGLRPC